MSDLLADVDLEPEPDAGAAGAPEQATQDIDMELEPEPIAPPLAPIAALPLAEVLPADFRLPALIRYVPNPALRAAAEEAASYALSIDVAGPEGLRRADVALVALRGRLKAIEDDFADPTDVANGLHTRLTDMRAEWCAAGKAALQIVGARIYTEQKRLKAVADEERRKAQEEADRQARETVRRAAEEAAKAKAPAAVVEELQQQAQTITAPPVQPSVQAPVLRGTTTVAVWRVRPRGTPAHQDPHPGMADLTPGQREQVLVALRAVLDGKAPLVVFEINYSYLDARARADKSTFAIPGFEAFDQGGIRAKSTRSRG